MCLSITFSWLMLAAPAFAGAGSSAVTHLAAADVRAAFSRGAPLHEVDAFKVHASRRDGAGEAEIHGRDTDVIYVLDGEADFVTGGTVADARTVAADELRGSRIDGGESRRLRQGDVIVVPNGVPHWFRAVPGPFVYYVVKVTANGGSSR